MKTSYIHSLGHPNPQRRASGACLAVMLAALIGAPWAMPICRAEAPATEPPAASPTPPAAHAPDATAKGVQVLTRGPVHEAFAGVVAYKPEPGIVVPKAPPANIEEVPPSERPEGNNVTWIPGYWSWDDERSDFVWVSGTWRALPPGRQWIPGYWSQTTEGYQWTSGYWADSSEKETTYLAEPPATLEDGPNVAAPSSSYRWLPGSWIWNNDRYAWCPGNWARGRADWDWTPSHYVWTPRGYVFVSGYWDYPVDRRGTLFAPVYFDSDLYAGGGYSYTPSVLLDVAALAENLFIRPDYCHYYFGDYYDPSYASDGFFSPLAYQSDGYGYDPIFSYQRWQHRNDRGWENRMMASYDYRRDNPNARPPRTWAAQQALAANSAQSRQKGMLLGRTLNQAVRSKNSAQSFQAVTKTERQKLALRGQEVAQARDQRRSLETARGASVARNAGGAMAPSKEPLARSPIVAKAANQLGKGRTPPPALRTPKPGAGVLPRTASAAHQPTVGNGGAATESRKSTMASRSRAVQPESRKATVTPRSHAVQPESRRATVTPRSHAVQPESRRAAVAPPTHAVQPVPHRAAVAPPTHAVQSVPHRAAVAPPTRMVQHVPRRAAVAPPTRAVQSVAPRMQPAARQAAPHGGAAAAPNGKDPRKNGKE